MRSHRHTGLGPEAVNELLSASPYRFVQFVGRGGVGEVFIVEDELIGRKFALKALTTRLAGDAEYVDRVRLEAQAIGRLRHPNIVEIVDFWIAPPSGSRARIPCIVMELLRGRTVAEELIERQQIAPGEAVEIMCQALSALAAAHAIGIVHRDVKPENLYLHEVPGYGRLLKVLDFGFARVLPDAPAGAPEPLNAPTRTGTSVGTPRYMSPEQARGERVDHRTDVYAAGLVLYDLLVGHGPFDFPGSSEAVPPSHYAGSVVPPELDRAVLRAISDNPSGRHPSAEAFRIELNQLLPRLRCRPGRS